MSLMSRIARRLVSRAQPEKPKAVPTSAPSRVVSRRETRKRISAGVLRRLEPSPVVAAAIPPPQLEANVRSIDDVEAEQLGILPNGELLDDVEPDWRSLRRGTFARAS